MKILPKDVSVDEEELIKFSASGSWRSENWKKNQP